MHHRQQLINKSQNVLRSHSEFSNPNTINIGGAKAINSSRESSNQRHNPKLCASVLDIQRESMTERGGNH